METSTALAIIDVFPSSKEELQRYHRTIKNEILSSGNPLQILAKVKYLEKVVKNILDDKEIKNHFLSELLLYSKKEVVKYHGVEMYEMEASVKYHYEDCGDVIYNDLIKQSKELSDKIKAREEYLKNLPAEGSVCPVNGNYLSRPAKSSTTVVACKIQ